MYYVSLQHYGDDARMFLHRINSHLQSSQPRSVTHYTTKRGSLTMAFPNADTFEPIVFRTDKRGFFLSLSSS